MLDRSVKHDIEVVWFRQLPKYIDIGRIRRPMLGNEVASSAIVFNRFGRAISFCGFDASIA